MGHLRQKLEAEAARPRHFITETGVGYRFVP
jgi:two-component system KDP operon response regulator KdpE